jgi:hypothetical protein
MDDECPNCRRSPTKIVIIGPTRQAQCDGCGHVWIALKRRNRKIEISEPDHQAGEDDDQRPDQERQSSDEDGQNR